MVHVLAVGGVRYLASSWQRCICSNVLRWPSADGVALQGTIVLAVGAQYTDVDW